MPDPCVFGDEIIQTRTQVSKIYDAIVGTTDTIGLIPRLTALERAHATMQKLIIGTTSVVLTSVVGAFFLWIFRVHT
jgi:pantothenate synthetase